jgi:hypothetical protein
MDYREHPREYLVQALIRRLPELLRCECALIRWPRDDVEAVAEQTESENIAICFFQVTVHPYHNGAS